MSDDRLEEATRALREQEPTSELEARATRARVMAGLHQNRVQKRTKLAFLLPIAATFVAASAWGAANGNARAWVERVERWVGISDVASVVPPKAPAARAPVVETAVTAPMPAPALVESPPAPAKAAPSASAGFDPNLALYRAAHRAHFVDHDAARALVAWDSYLAAAPRGQLAPEARYNRALSLVRLGRGAEARAALSPFASAPVGSYRQAEAAALLERLTD